jgi:hypothetical protein
MSLTALVLFSMRYGGTLLGDLKVISTLPERPTVALQGMMTAACENLQGVGR